MAITTITSPILGVDNEILELLLAGIGLTVLEIRPFHIVGITPISTEVDLDGTIIPPLLTNAQTIIDNHITFKDSNVRLFGRDQVVIATVNIGNILLSIDGTNTWEVDVNGDLLPAGTRNFGSASRPINQIYANEIIGGAPSITLANDTYLESRNFTDSADLGLVKGNTSDNTEVNTIADGDLLFTEDGTLIGRFTQTVDGYSLEIVSEASTDILPLSGNAVVIPDTAGNRSSVRFVNDSGGNLGGIVGEVETVGGDGTSVGSLQAVIVNAAVDTPVQTWLHNNIDFSPGGLSRWSVDSGGQFIQNATNGGDIVFQNSATGLDTTAIDLEFRVGGILSWLMANTGNDLVAKVDGLAIRQDATDKHLYISGGSGIVTTGGALIALYGNTHANTGRLDIAAGNAGIIQFITNGSNVWQIANDGALQSNSNDLVFTTADGLIRTDSVDATDTRRLSITSASAASSTRGAFINLHGNEHVSSAGELILEAGNVAGGLIRFNTGGVTNWRLENNGNLVGLNTATIIRTNADTKSIFISGGSSAGVADSAILAAYGNTHATFPGQLHLTSSTDGTGGILLTTTSAPIKFIPNGVEAWHIESDGDVIPQTTNNYNVGASGNLVATVFSRIFQTENGARIGKYEAGASSVDLGTTSSHDLNFISNDLARWQLDSSSGNLVSLATNGGDIVFSDNLRGILQGTSDAADDNSLEFSGGGAFRSVTRGAYLSLHGNEHGTRPGHLNLRAAGSSGIITLGNNTLDAAWTLDASSHLFPGTNGNQDIGKNTNHVRTLYVDSIVGTSFGVTSNNIWIQWRNAADDADINVLQVDSTDDTNLRSDTSNDINLLPGGTERWIFEGGSDPVLIYTNGSGIIRASTADASDNANISIAGGGGNSHTRGAILTLYGNEDNSQSVPGWLVCDTGDAANANMLWRLRGTTGGFQWHTDGATGAEGWRIDGSTNEFKPLADGTHDIGTTSAHVQEVFAHQIARSGGIFTVGTLTSHDLQFLINNTLRWQITSSGQTELKSHDNFTGSGHFTLTDAIQTTDATVTTMTDVAVPDNTVMAFEIIIVARFENLLTDKSYWYKTTGAVRRNNGGSAVIVGTPLEIEDDEGIPGYIASVGVSGNNLRISVTGASSEDVNWGSTIKYQGISLSA